MHLWTLLLSLLVERTTAFCSVTTSSTAAASETTLNYVQSPGYPSGYPPNEDCEWNISPADSSQRVMFYIEMVSLEARYDFLSIVDNGGTVWYSESYDQLYGITESGDVKVVFHSDYSIQYGGFSLMYMAVKTSDSDIAPCSSSLTASSTDQNLVYYFSSSSYLYQTGQSQSCSWTITASANQFIEISVPLYTTSNWYLLDLGQSSEYVSGSGPYITSGNTATVTSLDGAFILTYKEVSYSTTDATLTTTPSLDVTDMCDTSQLYADQTSRYLQSNNYPNPSFRYVYKYSFLIHQLSRKLIVESIRLLGKTQYRQHKKVPQTD
ncbi:CUB and sushi domain-containing protein 3-like [Mya arenaria]|uniref:CUB and sushi domain-containing protein 3-like n=1 Tax=Mya arenaria TaxID=6604 RepID=UPI0022E299A2|nr:CUB and sushi domain-containing protein 3-like [Mya arenaria]